MNDIGLFIAGAIVTLIVGGAIALLLVGAVFDGRTERAVSGERDRGVDGAASRLAAAEAIAAHAAKSQ